MYKIEENVAIEEFRSLYNRFNKKPIDSDKLLEQYPDVIEAIKNGNLTIEHDVPNLVLYSPILNDSREVELDKLKFKTRILPSEQRSISKGINVSKDQIPYVHKCYSFIIDQPMPMLDKFSKDDFATIEQLCSLFM